MYWVEISAKGSVLDYVYEDFPVIDNLDEYFGNYYDDLMGPQTYYLGQKVVESPPKEWLESELALANMRKRSADARILTLTKELKADEL